MVAGGRGWWVSDGGGLLLVASAAAPEEDPADTTTDTTTSFRQSGAEVTMGAAYPRDGIDGDGDDDDDGGGDDDSRYSGINSVNAICQRAFVEAGVEMVVVTLSALQIPASVVGHAPASPEYAKVSCCNGLWPHFEENNQWRRAVAMVRCCVYYAVVITLCC